MEDIFIIGNGLAGMSAALTLVQLGKHATVVSVCEPCRSQSVLAEGGINASLNTKNQNDSAALHAEDTLKAGCYLADPKAVERLTAAAPGIVKSLSRKGVVFSRDENGNINLRYFGGQKKMRTAFSKSGIGKQLVTGLSLHFYKYISEGKITFLKGNRFLSPVISDSGRCIGVILEDIATLEKTIHPASAVIAASGGLGNLFSSHTGALTNDAGVSASLFSHGVRMANLEMIQYHPTTIQTPSKCILISESARGEGGRLFTFKDGKRWYFMEELYPEGGNLMPRDVVSRTIHRICTEEGLGIEGKYQVGLQLEHLDKDILNDNLKEVCETAKTYLGIDPAKDYIPVSPGIHYFMGGIYVDYLHRTTMPGIYAAGECACQYHGANRLGGNSTLGAIFGGQTAAETAAGEATSPDVMLVERCGQKELEKMGKLTEKPSAAQMMSLHHIMDACLGVSRCEEKLSAGLQAVTELKAGADGIFLEKLLLAEAMVKSALARKESRGAQYRSDYPDTSDEFLKVTVSAYGSSGVTVSFDEIGRVFE